MVGGLRWGRGRQGKLQFNAHIGDSRILLAVFLYINAHGVFMLDKPLELGRLPIWVDPWMDVMAI